MDVLFDLVLAEYDGSSWSTQQLFEGMIMETVGETLEDVTLDVDGAAELLWAGEGKLMYHRQMGDVTVSLPAFTVLEGDISNETFMLEDDGAGLSASSYFDGETGGGFCWRNAGTQPVCAYIAADVVNIEQELLQFFQPTGPLVYWSP